MTADNGAKNKVIGASHYEDVKGLSRDRPWLLPSNRKLRHLQGVSVRNLALSKSSTRNRGKTVDDESLEYTLKTPAKILAQRENHKLGLSRSSNDLRSASTVQTQPRNGDSDGAAPSKLRPVPAKMRRSSTLNWTNAPPRVRQQKLEDVTAERLADTWFSLHCSGVEEPIYVSEVVEKAMNPSFRFFDLNIYGAMVTRQDNLTIKYWVRTETMENYILLVELQLHLRSLQFIGKTLESFHHPLPQNCILLHLTDGIYTSFTDMALEEPIIAPSRTSKQSQTLQPTSSFDALMRLSNLDDCIQDALSTREKLAEQIDDLLREQQEPFETINSTSRAEEHLASANRALTACRKQLKSAHTRRSDLQESLQARRTVIRSGQLTQEKAQTHLASVQANLFSRLPLLQNTKTALSGQIRRIGEDLVAIYPIDSMEPRSLSFSIRGLHLPNAGSPSEASKVDHTITAAALGIVAHVVHLLSFYLSTPLPYPPSPHGSTSTIQDPISTTLQSLPARTFPLYQKGAVTYRYEYGVFLLNSDIELLMSRQGSRMVDLRHTLPNLNYLLTVLTAGKGELPVRKKGGVKALENGRTPEGKRVGDEDETIEKIGHLDGKQRIYEGVQ